MTLESSMCQLGQGDATVRQVEMRMMTRLDWPRRFPSLARDEVILMRSRNGINVAPAGFYPFGDSPAEMRLEIKLD